MGNPEKDRAEGNFALAHRQNAKLIKTYSRNSFFHIPGFSEDDMEQELLAVLWFAVQNYDPTRGAFFNSYMQQCFRNRISTLRRAVECPKRSAELVSLDVEAVQLAIDTRRSLPSAEDTAVQREDVRESYEEGSPRIRRRFQQALSEAI